MGMNRGEDVPTVDAQLSAVECGPGGLGIGPIVVDCARFRARAYDAILPLTRLEFDLLAHLARNCSRVVPYHELMQQVIGSGSRSDNTVVRVHLCHLRRKLGAAAQFLVTVRG